MPAYYNKVGPGNYENIDIEKISSKMTTPGFKMGPEPQKTYEVLLTSSMEFNNRNNLVSHVKNNLSASETMSIAKTVNSTARRRPQHRFHDFKRDKLIGELKDHYRVKSARHSKKDLEEMEGTLSSTLANKVKTFERHEFLYPSKKFNWADSKMIKFTQRARPELFPVKDEHSRPRI